MNTSRHTVLSSSHCLKGHRHCLWSHSKANQLPCIGTTFTSCSLCLGHQCRTQMVCTVPIISTKLTCHKVACSDPAQGVRHENCTCTSDSEGDVLAVIRPLYKVIPAAFRHTMYACLKACWSRDHQVICHSHNSNACNKYHDLSPLAVLFTVGCVGCINKIRKYHAMPQMCTSNMSDYFYECCATSMPVVRRRW